MAEIDLDPNFRYRQAAQNTFFTGMQLGGQIADRRAAMAIRQQEVQLRQQQMEQAMADALVRQNLQDAQAQMYRQRMSEAIQESEANKADLPLMAQFMNQASIYAEDTTGQVKAPEAPVFQNPRMTIQAQNVLRDARAKNVGMRAQAKRVDDAIEAGAVTFGPNGQMTIDEQRLQSFQAAKRTQDALRSVSGATDVSLLTDETLAQMTGRPIEEIPALRETIASKGIAFNKEPMALKFVESVKASGIPLTPEEEEDVKAKYYAGVGALNAPADAVKNLNSEARSFNLLNKAIEDIDRFNAEYGADAFSQFVGPIDKGVIEQAAKRLPLDKQPKAIKDARNVFETVSKVIQGYRRGEFGTALSASESALFKGIVREPEFADYERSIKNFRNQLLRGIQYSAGQYKAAPNIPLSIRKQFFVEQPEEISTYEGDVRPTSASATNRVIRFDSQGNRIN